LLQGGRLLYSRHQALPKIFFGRLGQFAAKFKAKKCQVSENFVKKNGRPCPKGRRMISVQNVSLQMQAADMQKKLLQQLMHMLACFSYGCSGCCCGQIDAEKRDGTEQGVEYMFGSILKTSQK